MVRHIVEVRKTSELMQHGLFSFCKTKGIGKKTMTKLSVILALLLSGCAAIGIKEKTRSYGGKFAGEHSALAHCVMTQLQSDSRWLIRELGYDVRGYAGLQATEIYAYPFSSLPGVYARNSPLNPDGVFSYGPPVTRVHAFKPNKPNAEADSDAKPAYSFLLTIKRTDNATVVATINGKKYESDIAWEKLTVCSAP